MDEIFRPSLRALVAHSFSFVFALLVLLIYTGLIPLIITSVAGLLAGAILFIIALAGFVILDYLMLKNTWAQVREEGIFIGRGIIAKSRSMLLYSQIQDVKENESFIDMLIGTKSITVETMSNLSATAGSIPALSRKDADALRSAVLARILGKGRGGDAKAQGVGVQDAARMVPNPFKLQIGKIISAQFVIIAALAAVSFMACAAVVVFLGLNIGILAPVLAAFVAIAVLLLGIVMFGSLMTGILYSYSVGEETIMIEYGLFSKTRVQIPLSKVQQLTISQGAIERYAGIAHFIIDTGAMPTVAGSSKSPVVLNSIPLLLKDDAVKLRAFILKSAGYVFEEEQPALVGEGPLDSSSVIKRTAGSAFSFALLGAIALALIFFFAPKGTSSALYIALALGTVVIAVIVVLQHVYNNYYLKNYYYNMAKDLLVVRTGVLGRHETVLPIDKIQNVFIDQDLFDRIFGLWDIHTSTAGFRAGMHVHIDGLNSANAAVMRGILLKAVSSKGKK